MLLKKYRVNVPWQDHYVILEVDHDKLTPTLAYLINDFWSDAENRLEAQNDDVVLTVVRLFGSLAINYFLGEGNGIDGPLHNDSGYWTQKVIDYQHEGWPDYETLGIKIIGGEVNVPTYHEVELEAL